MSTRSVVSLFGVKDSYMVKTVAFALTAAGAANAISDLGVNPENEAVLILEVLLNVTTTSTGTAGLKLDFGINADGTGTAADIFDNADDAIDVYSALLTATVGTLVPRLSWAKDYHITQTMKDQTSAALVGELVITYLVKVQESD